MSLLAKKKYICKYAAKLNHADLVDIGKTFVRCGFKDKIKHSVDGAHINLDNLDDTVFIDRIYNMVKHKNNREHKINREK